MYSITRRKDFRTKSKYKNKSKFYNGRTFDSIGEANHYEELLWRQKAGEISEIIPQHKIELRVKGKLICNYYVDFKVVMADGSVQLHEYKGMVLPLWQIKWNLLEALIDEIEPGAEMIVIRHK